MDDAPRPKRRRLPCRLRTLLLFALVLLAMQGTWFAVKMEQAERQRAAIEEIENLGGVVWYDYQLDADGVPKTEEAQPAGPWWLRRFLGDDLFRNVVKLDLTQTEIDDEGLKRLEGLTDLESLSLGERVTDAGLVHLEGLPQLHALNLRATQVTAAGVLDFQKAAPNCAIRR